MFFFHFVINSHKTNSSRETKCFSDELFQGNEKENKWEISHLLTNAPPWSGSINTLALKVFNNETLSPLPGAEFFVGLLLLLLVPKNTVADICWINSEQMLKEACDLAITCYFYFFDKEFRPLALANGEQWKKVATVYNTFTQKYGNKFHDGIHKMCGKVKDYKKEIWKS